MPPGFTFDDDFDKDDDASEPNTAASSAGEAIVAPRVTVMTVDVALKAVALRVANELSADSTRYDETFRLTASDVVVHVDLYEDDVLPRASLPVGGTIGSLDVGAVRIVDSRPSTSSNCIHI